MNHPDQGEVSISGKPVRIRTVSQATRLGIAYVPEDRIRQGLVIGSRLPPTSSWPPATGCSTASG